MDIARPRPKRRSLPWIIGGGVLVVALATLGMSQLKPAAPEIERGSLWLGTVKRGPMLRAVSGNGSLVPESQRIVVAMTAGRIERVNARPGAAVEADDVLVEMSNPDVQLSSLEAERQLKLAEAELASLRASLEGARLLREAQLAAARTAKREADRGLAGAERLAAEGLASGNEVERARDAAAEAATRFESERRMLELSHETYDAQLDLRRADVERLRAIARFERERVASMKVCAGAKGTVQELSLEPGSWVQSGQTVARVASSERLKAVLRVPELLARDLGIGLPVIVDTREAKVQGRVSRIDPGVTGGTVAVDVAFDAPLPAGARPDLSVDGRIEIEKIANALYVERPANAPASSRTFIFKLESGGHGATRVPVRFGRASSTEIEIAEGLNAGDQVILSDMSQWDHVQRVRLR